MKNDINKIQFNVFKGKLTRFRFANDSKRRIGMTARNLYIMLQCDITYKQFCMSIKESHLRIDTDYQFTDKNVLLSLSSVQAILVMSNSELSWQLHHALTDLIHNGFSDLN
ncbi:MULTISPECIES: hypothetical protein [unclassified Acinetobacter]|uniref:hypothetical protein n=1 Tax=unclassified Acinetobacter TaxID=196816 RepID=UPI0022AC6122|nr:MULTISPECIES: hypothetical protein [unclassified Acinetobacter]WAU72973.1 hypothetical protein O1450_12890 [Acinetobacter sp. TR11]WAU76067.1 hypothetical protein O1449_12405 [Acinetobacter sp. TR3]